MFLIVLLSIVTLAISGSAAFFSVYGLAQTFTSAFIPVVIMGSSLEAGKLITSSFLYRYWKVLSLQLKVYLIFAVFGLMFLTSWGIFGYLSASYQSDSLALKQNAQHIEYLNNQKLTYESRLSNIDTQIKNVPEKAIRSKIQLIKTLSDEKKDILTRLDNVNTERSNLMNTQISTEVKTGPIVFVAKALNRTVDQATTYLIFIIMAVFDPLAVALTIAINVAINQRKIELAEKCNVEILQQTITPIIDAKNSINVNDELSHVDSSSITHEPIIQETEMITPTPTPDTRLDTVMDRLENISNDLNTNTKRHAIINSMREDV